VQRAFWVSNTFVSHDGGPRHSVLNCRHVCNLRNVLHCSTPLCKFSRVTANHRVLCMLRTLLHPAIRRRLDILQELLPFLYV